MQRVGVANWSVHRLMLEFAVCPDIVINVVRRATPCRQAVFDAHIVEPNSGSPILGRQLLPWPQHLPQREIWNRGLAKQAVAKLAWVCQNQNALWKKHGSSRLDRPSVITY